MASLSKKRPLRKMFTAFCITIIAVLLIAGGGYAAYRNLVRPPDVAEYVMIPVPVTRATTAPDTREEDNQNNVYAVLDKPQPDEEVTYEYLRFERRPLFYTVLIYGLDDGNNVDALFVAAFDGEAGQAYIVSIPRDTRVESTRGVGRSKLVASYSAGRSGGRGHEGGIYQLKAEVATLIGFVPDFYMSVNYRAFTRIVDTLGGVSVFVPFHMMYNDPYQNLHINIPAGQQRLNGQQALNFARFRQADEGFRGITDFQRASNQQILITSILNELLSTPRNITRIPELVRIYQEHVTTNMSTLEMAWFVEQTPAMLGREVLTSHQLPMARTERQGWYEIPDPEGILEVVNSTINPFTTDITLEMLRIVD